MRMRDLMTIVEGRVYQLDGGYPLPVAIFSNPSISQARTLARAVHEKRQMVYLRGLMVRKTVYIWDGFLMTHDDVLTALESDTPDYSDDLTTFEIANYRNTGFMQIEKHPAKVRIVRPGNPNPESASFVRNVVAAIDALQVI